MTFDDFLDAIDANVCSYANGGQERIRELLVEFLVEKDKDDEFFEKFVVPVYRQMQDRK